jgi:hypothetical protein
MDPRTLGMMDTLGRALLWAAVAVIGLTLIGAAAIISSDNAVGFLDEDIQRQGRGILAIGAFAGGLTAAGLLAGLGALLRLKVAEHRERQK